MKALSFLGRLISTWVTLGKGEVMLKYSLDGGEFDPVMVVVSGVDSVGSMEMA